MEEKQDSGEYKNLEIKYSVFNGKCVGFGNLHNTIKPHYNRTLIQKDTYFYDEHDRLKLREERDCNGKNECNYMLRYQREDIASEKMSNYIRYNIDNLDVFLKVMGPHLVPTYIIEKYRSLYLYKNARIQLDTVIMPNGKEYYIEIEVVIKTKEEEDNKYDLMNEIKNIVENDLQGSLEIIDIGYLELYIKKQQILNSTMKKKVYNMIK